MCTHIIWLTQQRLTYYTGNYDTYVKTVQENEVIQQKKHEKEQDDIKHIKAFIASCGARLGPCKCTGWWGGTVILAARHILARATAHLHLRGEPSLCHAFWHGTRCQPQILSQQDMYADGAVSRCSL